MKAFTIRLSVFAIIVLYLSNLTMTESFMSELYQQKIDSTNSLAVPVGRDCNGLSRKESKSLSFWIPQKYDFWTTVNRTTHGSGTVTDFLDGTFDLTEVVQGSSQVTLSRRWTSNKNITSELAGIEQYYPYIVANENGDLYLIWQDERDGTADIYFSYSIDDGETWLSHTKINDDNDDANQERPSLAVGKDGTLYATWQDNRQGQYQIYFSRSLDEGKTWTTNMPLTTDTQSSNQCHCGIVADTQGNLYTAWQDFRNGDADIYFSYSDNKGKSWYPAIKINDDESDAFQDSASVTVGSNGLIYVAWQDNRSGDANIYFSQSEDMGQTWTPNIIINDDDDGQISFEDSPKLATDNTGKIYLAWRSYADSQFEIYFAHADGGDGWSESVKLNARPVQTDPDSTVRDNPSLAIDNQGNVYVIWQDYRHGNADIYFAISNDGGSTWGTNLMVNDDEGQAKQSNPHLVVDNSGMVHAVWEDYRNGESDIYMAHWPDVQGGNPHFYTNGTYTMPYNTNHRVAWQSLTWESMQPASTTVTIRVRTSINENTNNLCQPDKTDWTDWTTYTFSPADLSLFPVGHCLQLETELSSSSSTTTPSLNAVVLDWNRLIFLPLVMK